jgi:type II secretory pathway predicted ATPase ExeA
VGSGKSTARRKFFEKAAENGNLQVVFPQSYDKEKLTEHGLMHSIIADLTEEVPKGRQEGLARRAGKLLLDRSKNGERVVLVIEEAQDLTVKTLKILKRMWEMENGFRRLLAIILIGQNELENRLYDKNRVEVREVASRTMHIRMDDLGNQTADYIKHRLKSAGADVNKIITPEAIEAIKQKMQVTDGRNSTSIIYPIHVDNFMVRCMNHAVACGEELVTPTVVNAVRVN